MSNLTDLVPPLDLCKKIPEGEFADSAFAYFYDANGANITLDKREGDAIWKDEVAAPAPTLQEIMAELPSTTVCGKEHHSDWYVSHWRIGCVTDTERKGAATAALKLWLKLKGIEDE